MGLLFDLLFRRKRQPTLEEVLFATKRVVVHGIIFEIRKVNQLDFARGAKVHAQWFQTYEKANAEMKAKLFDEKAEERTKDHFRDTFMSAVVSFGKPPRQLCYKKDEGKEGFEGRLCVDNLLTDWEFAQDLYVQIVQHSFGKKKPT
jgi:hypothetical protein